MSIYKDGKLIAGGRQCMPLLSFMWADHVLNDASWLRADTFSWQDGSVYQAAYNHLVDDLSQFVQSWTWGGYINLFTASRYPQVGDIAYLNPQLTGSGYEIISVTDTTITTAGYTCNISSNITMSEAAQAETISGITISFYTAADGHKIVLPDQESNVAAIYAATGVAWYYIIDTTNQRFKLPRAKHNKYATSTSITSNGNTPRFHLTSDTSKVGGLTCGASISGTASQIAGMYDNSNIGSSTSGRAVSFDNSEIGLQVTQPAQDTDQYKYLYFYVGNFTQMALENTAGLNASLFNNKVDLDAGNLSATGKETVAHQAMPSSRYDSLTLGATGTTYTAPADGWFYISAKTSGTNYQVIMAAGSMSVSFRSNSLNQRMILPVSKGMVMSMSYDGTLSDTTFRFVYAEGAQ